MVTATAEKAKQRSAVHDAVSEKDFMANVIGAARLRGWAAYHAFDSRRSDPGWPDLAMARGERLIFAELKTMRGRVTAAQTEWLEALRATGAETYVWRPDQWAQIDEVLR